MILSSTLLLTLLLCIGLFFFVRASVKDRTQSVRLIAQQAESSLMTRLQQYLEARSYRIVNVDAAQKLVTFEGFVQPSWFMAIFLSVLSAIGSLCFALVLSTLVPHLSLVFLGLIPLSLLTGIFYWQRAGRTEQVSLRVEAIADDDTQLQSLITVTCHRDELTALQQTLQLQYYE